MFYSQCIVVMSVCNVMGKKAKFKSFSDLRSQIISFLHEQRKMRVLLLLVTYGSVAVVGNLETAVRALWHTICIWVWKREFPSPSEIKGISCFAFLFLRCKPGLLMLGIKCFYTSALCLLVLLCLSLTDGNGGL